MFSIKEAILPNSVFIPVPKTTALALPVATLVPAKAIFFALIEVSGISLSASYVFLTGVASPSKEDWLVVKSDALIILASALMLSPSFKIMISPGTKSLASICFSFPSLITLAKEGSILDKASVDLFALNCWIKENTPFMILIKNIAIPRYNIPGSWSTPIEEGVSSAIKQEIIEIVPLIQRSIAIKETKFLKNKTKGLTFFFSFKTFLPYFSNLILASSSFKPCEEVFSNSYIFLELALYIDSKSICSIK